MSITTDKELRNVFAHNDNPVIVEIYSEHIDKIRQISGVEVDSNNYVVINDESVIFNACKLYTNFLEVFFVHKHCCHNFFVADFFVSMPELKDIDLNRRMQYVPR